MNKKVLLNSILMILMLLGAYYVFAGINNVTLDSPATGANTTNTSVTFQCTATPNGTETVTNISIGFNFSDGNGAYGQSHIVINRTNTTVVANTTIFAYTAFPEGRFLWNCIAGNSSAFGIRLNNTFSAAYAAGSNGTAPSAAEIADAGVVANYSNANSTIIVDGGAPDNVTLIFPNALNVNVTFRNLTNTDFTNGSVTVRWSVHDDYMTRSVCNVTVNGVVRSTNVAGYSGGNTTDIQDHNFTTSVTGFNSLLTNTWSVACTDHVGNSNSSNTSGTINIVDSTAPYEISTLTFKGTKNGAPNIIGTEFDYGKPVTISNCNGTENVDYFNSNATIDIRLPDVSSFKIIKNDTSGIGEVEFTDTSDLGSYLVRCIYRDGSGNFNSTNKTFTVKAASLQRSSAVAIPGFKVSKGTTIVGSDTQNDAGALGKQESSFLFRQGGAVIFNVKGEKHTFQVIEISGKTVTLKASSVSPFEVTLNEGDTKNLDVTGDGEADVAVTLNQVNVKGQADVTFVLVEGIEADAGPEGTQPTATQPTALAAGNGLWIVIAIIVIVLIVGYFLIKRK
ncbi:MAG: hypothetical protein Q8Q30_01935 [Candidatus Woesebacteria bacterium]|nr:hypothetical protein [Candidatus Woesebacteria bacterium]